MSELNDQVWCKLAPSPIHGIGVFAIRDIPKGTKLYAQNIGGWLCTDPLDELLPEIKELVLQRWPDAATHGYFSPNDDARLLSFMNHSTEPNYDPSTDKTIKVIHRGEEVFEDYGFVV